MLGQLALTSPVALLPIVCSKNWKVAASAFILVSRVCSGVSYTQVEDAVIEFRK
jgi:hypothetical protein